MHVSMASPLLLASVLSKTGQHGIGCCEKRVASRAVSIEDLATFFRCDGKEAFYKSRYKLTRLAAGALSTGPQVMVVNSRSPSFHNSYFRIFRRYRRASIVVRILESGSFRPAVIDGWAAFCGLPVEAIHRFGYKLTRLL